MYILSEKACKISILTSERLSVVQFILVRVCALPLCVSVYLSLSGVHIIHIMCMYICECVCAHVCLIVCNNNIVEVHFQGKQFV